MTDKWQGWKITDEQAEAINNDSAEARNWFYVANLPRIRRMAYGAMQNHWLSGADVEDMVSTVYLDMALWTYRNKTPIKNGADISHFVFKSFGFAPYGGVAYLAFNNPKVLCSGEYRPKVVSLDTPMGRKRRKQDEVNAMTLLDYVSDSEETEEPFPLDFVSDDEEGEEAVSLIVEDEPCISTDYAEDCKRICGKYLSPREAEYFGYIVEGFPPFAALEHMGIKQCGSLWDRITAKLRVHYKAIITELLALGIKLPRFAFEVPEGYEKACKKFESTPEQRAKARENMRRSRAKKKAEARAQV